MLIKLNFKFQLATLAILALTIALPAAGRCAYGVQPISLQQPATSLIVKTGVEKSPLTRNESSIVQTPTSQRVAMLKQKQPSTPANTQVVVGAPFTPHYLCLCPPYCPKPIPCAECCYKCCLDCYCPKPMPCPNPCYDCVCDDYCPKQMPCRFPQPLCGPRAPCRKSEPCPIYAPLPPRGPCVGQ